MDLDPLTDILVTMETDGLPDLHGDAEAAGRAFRALFEHAPLGICALTVDGRIFAANPRLQRMMGLTQYRGLLVEDFAPPGEVERVNRALVAAVTGGIATDEGRLVRPDGSHIDTRATLMRVHAPTGDPSFVLAVVEARGEVEETVARTRRLVHDINNLLTPIVLYAERLLKSSPPSEPAHADAEQLHELAEKTVALVRASLSERPAEATEASVDVNGVLLGLRSVVADLLGAGIGVVVTPDLGQPHARADAIGLERALLNIASNARDAMPDGGTLRIETGREGDAVVIWITDTGIGMDRETLDHVFEPRFTTKATGHGIGLASVRDFAEKYGGSVTVESKPGLGTTFALKLPSSDRASG